MFNDVNGKTKRRHTTLQLVKFSFRPLSIFIFPCLVELFRDEFFTVQTFNLLPISSVKVINCSAPVEKCEITPTYFNRTIERLYFFVQFFILPCNQRVLRNGIKKKICDFLIFFQHEIVVWQQNKKKVLKLVRFFYRVCKCNSQKFIVRLMALHNGKWCTT